MRRKAIGEFLRGKGEYRHTVEQQYFGTLGEDASAVGGGSHGTGIIWSADFFGNDVMPAIRIFRTMKVTYYDSPVPYANVYDVEVDNNHMVWASLRNADRVGRLDPTTGKWTVYNLPTLGVEARNIAVDQKTGDVWLASFRASKAIRLQFRVEH